MSLLLKKAIKLNSTLQSFKPNNVLPLFLHQSTKQFSTETQPPPPPPPSQEKNDPSSIDPFLQDSAGLTYAKFYGVRKHTLKTDIINLFEGSNLTPDDIRVIHNRLINTPSAAVIQFPSRRAYDNAQKALTRAGRIYSMEKTIPSVWDTATLRNSYNGKTVLLEGLPQNALTEDIERFLSGCEFVPSSIRTFLMDPDSVIAQGRKYPTTSEEKTDPATEKIRDPSKIATVRFSTPAEAMNALIKKNGGFCLNNQVSVRVIH